MKGRDTRRVGASVVLALSAMIACASGAQSMCAALAQKEIAAEGAVAASATPEAQYDADMRKLLVWCTADASCKSAYQQAMGKDEAVFRFLARPVYTKHAAVYYDTTSTGVRTGLYTPLREMVCMDYAGARAEAQTDTQSGPAAYDVDLDEMTRVTWLRLMLSERPHDDLLCDVNHRLWFDAATMRAECVCREDRRCEDKLHSPTLLYMIMTLGLALAAVAVVLQVVRMVNEMGFMTEVLTHKEAHTPIEESLVLLHECL